MKLEFEIEEWSIVKRIYYFFSLLHKTNTGEHYANHNIWYLGETCIECGKAIPENVSLAFLAASND